MDDLISTIIRSTNKEVHSSNLKGNPTVALVNWFGSNLLGRSLIELNLEAIELTRHFQSYVETPDFRSFGSPNWVQLDQRSNKFSPFVEPKKRGFLLTFLFFGLRSFSLGPPCDRAPFTFGRVQKSSKLLLSRTGQQFFFLCFGYVRSTTLNSSDITAKLQSLLDRIH